MRLFPVKTKTPAAPPKQILKATVVRRSSAASIQEEEEPTTSFTTALFVVLLLHLVAAGGVVMFNQIKTHHPTAFESSSTTSTSKTTKLSQATPAPVAAVPARPKTADVPAPVASEPVKKTAPAITEIKDSGTLYTVAKGDNPVNIAKKLHVTQEDLLKLNKIDDPKKLKIGQKLRVPLKARASAN